MIPHLCTYRSPSPSLFFLSHCWPAVFSLFLLFGLLPNYLMEDEVAPTIPHTTASSASTASTSIERP